MAEYIERNSVMREFADRVKRSNNSDFVPVPTWNEAVQIVEGFPSADVRPVTHERWKAFDFHTVACSGCGFKVDIMAVPSYVLNHLYHCPNCGADMQKEGGEEDV